MATVKVSPMRSLVSESPDGLSIAIPAQKRWFLILFLRFWILGWAFGEVSTIREIIDAGQSPHGSTFSVHGDNLFLLG
jgi:hypothetical protein